jgi:hypothetical protein
MEARQAARRQTNSDRYTFPQLTTPLALLIVVLKARSLHPAVAGGASFSDRGS